MAGDFLRDINAAISADMPAGQKANRIAALSRRATRAETDWLGDAAEMVEATKLIARWLANGISAEAQGPEMAKAKTLGIMALLTLSAKARGIIDRNNDFEAMEAQAGCAAPEFADTIKARVLN